MRFEAEKYASGEQEGKEKTFTNSKHSFGQKDGDKEKKVAVETVVKFKQYDSLAEVETELTAKEPEKRDENLLAILNNVALKEQKRGVASLNLGASATTAQVTEAMEKFPSTWTILSIIEEEERTRKSAKQDVETIKSLFADLTSGKISQDEFLAKQAALLGIVMPAATAA